MNKLTKYIYKKVLKKTLGNICPSSIPRSGDEVKNVNCFVIYLKKNVEYKSMVTSILGETIDVLEWQDNRFQAESKISLEDLSNYTIEITHFYKEYKAKYTSVRSYILNSFFKLTHLGIFYSDIKQFSYNQKTLVRLERIEVLKFLINSRIEDEKDSFSSWQIMESLYSHRWYKHREGGNRHRRLRLVLGSLIETRDIEKRDSSYVVAGKALDTLSKFELEERRHRENTSLQSKMVILTVVIAFSAVIFGDKDGAIFSYLSDAFKNAYTGIITSSK